jgi:hypothetical protein
MWVIPVKRGTPCPLLASRLRAAGTTLPLPFGVEIHFDVFTELTGLVKADKHLS